MLDILRKPLETFNKANITENVKHKPPKGFEFKFQE